MPSNCDHMIGVSATDDGDYMLIREEHLHDMDEDEIDMNYGEAEWFDYCPKCGENLNSVEVNEKTDC